MNVLQLISSNGFFGAENVMVELSKELRLHKYEPFIGIIGKSKSFFLEVAREIDKNNLRIKIFNCNGKFDIRVIRQIRRYIKENRIDIIHSHNYKSNFYGFFSSFDMHKRIITTCHNWLGQNAKMKFYERIDKLLLNKFDKVVVVSDVLKEEVLGEGIPEEKVTVINNGVDIEKFHAAGGPATALETGRLQVKKSLGLKENDRVIGTIGRLTPEKGHIYLLKAFSRLNLEIPNLKLLIIGDGPLRHSLELGVRSLQLEDKVIFAGVRNDIPQMLGIMDIFVLPSLIEGMPLALLEAMAAQKPIIATKVGAIHRLIEDNKTGLLIEAKDGDGIRASIELLLKDKGKTKLLSLNAFEKVKNEFSSSIMAKKYLEVYKEILSEEEV